MIFVISKIIIASETSYVTAHVKMSRFSAMCIMSSEPKIHGTNIFFENVFPSADNSSNPNLAYRRSVHSI